MNLTTPYRQINGLVSSEINYIGQIVIPSIFLETNPLISGTSLYDRYERYEGLDLNYLRNAMDSDDFQVFLNFVGEEAMEVNDEDFEVYYPDED